MDAFKRELHKQLGFDPPWWVGPLVVAAAAAIIFALR